MNLPEFTGKELRGLADSLGRFVRMTRMTHASGRVKCDLLLKCCKSTLADVLVAQRIQYPYCVTDLSIQTEIPNLGMLRSNRKAARISELLADLYHWWGD